MWRGERYDLKKRINSKGNIQNEVEALSNYSFSSADEASPDWETVLTNETKDIFWDEYEPAITFRTLKKYKEWNE